MGVTTPHIVMTKLTRGALGAAAALGNGYHNCMLVKARARVLFS